MSDPKILVLGGRGFLGSRVAEAMRRLPGAEVAVGSRRGGGGSVQIDITDSSSRAAMAGYDVVVNCTDSTEAPPERAAEYCLLSGITFVETSAHPEVVERLYQFALRVPDPSGSLVLCAGVFPGLSNLLAAEVAGDDAVRIDLGIRYSPLSHAGLGVCRLMADLLALPARRFERGQMVEDLPIRAGRAMSFGGVERSPLQVGLAEALMLHRSCGAPSTATFLATIPGLPLSVQRVATLLCPFQLLRSGLVRWLTSAMLFGLRRGLLGWRASAVQIAAEATDAVGSVRRQSLRVADGFRAAALATAATVSLLRERRPSAGVHWIDGVLDLGEVLSRMRDLGSDGLEVEIELV